MPFTTKGIFERRKHSEKNAQNEANSRRQALPYLAPAAEKAYNALEERFKKANATLKAARDELQRATDQFTSLEISIEDLPAWSRRRQELTVLCGDLKTYAAELEKAKNDAFHRLENARRQDHLSHKPLKTLED